MLTDQYNIDIIQRKLDEFFKMSWGTPWIAETSTWGYPDEPLSVPPSPVPPLPGPLLTEINQPDDSNAMKDPSSDLSLPYIIDRTPVLAIESINTDNILSPQISVRESSLSTTVKNHKLLSVMSMLAMHKVI
jgi:hypothetical protein